MTRHTRSDGSRTYTVPDGDGGELELPSVTTVLKVMGNQALVYWAANSVANYALDNLDTVKGLLDKGDRDGAYRLLKGSPWAKRDKAAETGTSVHDLIERFVLGDKDAIVNVPPAETPFVLAFSEFIAEHPGTFEASEMTVFNLTHGYAGTADALYRVKDRLGLLDWKTKRGKSVKDVTAYESELLQVAAYCHAEFVLLKDGTVAPMPKVDGGSVVSLCDDGFVATKVEPRDFEGFLRVLALYQWKEGAK